jgi:DNA uptake protein ComE-like DNA-binding protein
VATTGERNALMFLAAVAVLGVGTRLIRSPRTEAAADLASIDAQLALVDSARDRAKGKARGRSRNSSAATRPEPAANQRVVRIDLDRASKDEIDRLPGIGPVLADRIIAERNAHGAFGCLAALETVKGIGPALARKLDSLVTFTGARRPDCS